MSKRPQVGSNRGPKECHANALWLRLFEWFIKISENYKNQNNCVLSARKDIPCLKLWILKIGFFGPKIFFQEKSVMRHLSTHKSSYFVIGFSFQLKMNENSENRSECVVAQNFINKSYLIYVKSEKYVLLITFRPLRSMREGETELSTYHYQAKERQTM